MKHLLYGIAAILSIVIITLFAIGPVPIFPAQGAAYSMPEDLPMVGNEVDFEEPQVEKTLPVGADNIAFAVAEQTNELRAEPSEEVALEREGLMMGLAKESPKLFLEKALSEEEISQYSPEVQQYIEKPYKQTVKMIVQYSENFETGEGNLEYYVTDATGKKPLFLTEDVPLVSGAEVEVAGYSLKNALVADSRMLKLKYLPPPDTLGPQKTLVVLMRFPDAPPAPFTRETVERYLEEGRVKKFFAEASYGQVGFDFDVMGWYELQRPSKAKDYWGEEYCDFALAQDVYDIVGERIREYERLIVFTDSSCYNWWAGLGTIGRGEHTFTENPDELPHRLSVSWIQVTEYPEQAGRDMTVEEMDNYFSFVISHELGHNFGAGHGNRFDCADHSRDSTCQSVEYGHSFDVMGMGQYAWHFNSYFKELFQWFDDGMVKTLDQPGAHRVTLHNIEMPGGVKAVRIPSHRMRTTGTWRYVEPYDLYVERTEPRTGYYYLDYRQPVGFDTPRWPDNDYRAGLMVQWMYETTIDGVVHRDLWLNLLNLQHDVSPHPNQPALSMGATYTDANGIRIGPILSESTESVTVEIAIPPPLTLKAEPVTVPAGRKAIVHWESVEGAECTSSLDTPRKVNVGDDSSYLGERTVTVKKDMEVTVRCSYNGADVTKSVNLYVMSTNDNLTMSNLAPSGVLHYETRKANLSLETGSPAECRYSSVEVPFDYMSPFAKTFGRKHSQPLSGLLPEQSFAYYISCRFAIDGSLLHSGTEFRVGDRPAAPLITFISPLTEVVNGTVPIEFNVESETPLTRLIVNADSLVYIEEYPAAGNYSIAWDTTVLSNGKYLISVYASNNFTSSGDSWMVTVEN